MVCKVVDNMLVTLRHKDLQDSILFPDLFQ